MRRDKPEAEAGARREAEGEGSPFQGCQEGGASPQAQGRRLIRSLLRSLLILAVFVPVAAAMPLAAMSLCRTPDGAMAVFWLGPWSCCFWVLIYSQLSAAPWRQGAEAVREWRAEHGGLLHTSIFACGWMFGALFFSYVAEGAFLFLTRSFAMLPLATYSPLAFAWCWRRVRPAR